MCTVLIQNPNFLILDEPTNDLDIITSQVLEDFLLDFPGNLLVVSHDRYFMDKIIDHLFVFEGNGLITDFPGNYTDYRVYEDSSPAEPARTEKKKADVPVLNQSLSYSEKKEYGVLEKDIAQLEKKKTAIELQFAENSLDQNEIASLSHTLQQLMAEIEKKENRWLELSMKSEQ